MREKLAQAWMVGILTMGALVTLLWSGLIVWGLYRLAHALTG